MAGKWQVYLDDNRNKQVVVSARGFWYADPFLFADKQKYIFVEAFRIKKEIGTIGYLKEEENYKKLHLLIDNNYHHSFPNVFRVDKQIYMIPESGESHGMFLYKFDDFPEKLSLVKELIHGDFVDTALVSIENSIGFFLSYKSKERELYQITIDFNSLDVSYKLLLFDENKQLRPAGNSFIHNGILVVPFQNCKNKYGESILLKQVETVSGLVSVGKTFETIDSLSFEKEMRITRIHTLNHCEGNCSIYDFMVDKFSISKPFKMLRRILRRKRHKDNE